ncbi:MAG: type II toxin-antitoxin system VapC family toxin [Chloroflexi bacterium]|nr:type II toxin-antitoxin system VapC family toxin [Chloroflexota bacterium]
MKQARYLFDTHALVFWNSQVTVSPAFIQFFDSQNQQGTLYVSAISFWEIALLVQKNRLAIRDVQVWQTELLQHTNLHLLDPTVTEMIASTLLPPHHKDPFDRLLIAQAHQHELTLVTQDQIISQYAVATYWMQ